MTETIVLDATGIAVNRTQLDITSWVAAETGPNWGDAEITAFMADQAVGSSPVDYRLPNRQISIPLNLKSISGGTSFSSIRASLQAKVGLLQREGGWIMRQVGATPLYADIVNATLHLGGSWLQAYRDIDVDAILTLECVPDWYGDEVTLSTHTETVLPHLFFTEATINGNYPSRTRIVTTNGTAVDQHGLLWGIRSRNYNAGTTAALFYEAEALTKLSSSAGTAISGASGGTAVSLTMPAANVWIPILSTHMISGTVPLTHTGTYRVWGRCYSATATPQYRFQWGAGAASVPVTNDPVVLPGTAAFYLLDLGEIRLDAPPLPPNQWTGVVQAQASAVNNQAAIDLLYFQPLDDGAGKLTYVSTPPASSIHASSTVGTAVNDAAVGTVTWLIQGPGAFDLVFLSTSAVSEYLKATNFGFSIPSSATITGVTVSFARNDNNVNGPIAQDNQVQLVKASTVQSGTNHANGLIPLAMASITYGGSADLWGVSLTPTDVNNSGFGFAVSIRNTSASHSAGTQVDHSSMTMTVYYTLASGFTIAPDAVIAASRTIELRTDGMYRQGGGGTIYAPASTVIGDLPRVPPSGLESRTCQFFLKMSRGNLASEADSGIDDMSAQVIYRPSYLYTT